MKRLCMLFVCACVSLATVFAAEGPFGIGIVFGEPTGVSFAYRLGSKNTLQGTLAWDLTSPGGFTVAGDYLFLFDKTLKIEKTWIPLYAGIGAKLTVLMGGGKYGDVDSPIGICARVPLGVRWLFIDVPLEAFLEIVPGFRFIPDTAFDFGAGIGLRWYFKGK
ncbi:MAG: hypothetical protein WCT14_16660 [Treponemataceae bacterium]